jgi:LmbE family N-acetylglucosaminyl deacetylase
VLILSPHPDDGEIGCGGTIARFIEEEKTVYHALFCAAENVGVEAVSKDQRYEEFRAANEMMGIEFHNTYIRDFPHRELHTRRQDILQTMLDLKVRVDPDLVLMPCPDDLHQDHRTIATEGVRAFKKCNLWGYEMLWNNLTFHTHNFVRLQLRHVIKKNKVIHEYKTQKHRDYFNDGFVESLAQARGTQIGFEYAEVFEHIRGVI